MVIPNIEMSTVKTASQFLSCMILAFFIYKNDVCFSFICIMDQVTRNDLQEKEPIVVVWCKLTILSEN